jgi:hypothetical protein
MAKKASNKTEEFNEAVTIEETIAEATPVPVVIAKSETPLRKVPSLESKYIIGKMNIGTAYIIIKEVNSKIHGDFYLLENDCYITKNGNYILN